MASGVVLDVDFRAACFELVLVNCGDEVVTDVAVHFSKKLVGVGGQTVVSDLPIWGGVGTMRPGKEIRVLYDTAANVFRRKGKNAFTATVTWTSELGRNKVTFAHDLDAYRGMPEIVVDPHRP